MGLDILIILIGILFIVSPIFILFRRTRRELLEMRLRVDNAVEEKDAVLDFMRKLSEDMSKGAGNERLYESIVRTTASSCGALASCFYERMPDGVLKVRAVEGLFPPQRTIRLDAENKISRSEFLEKVLENQELEANEGLIGLVANTMKPLLIEDAAKDPRVIKHADESLRINSIIVVPVGYGDDLHGVLAVVNPISGKFFDETELSVATSLAGYSALALKNSETLLQLVEKNKMDLDLDVASSVQSYLLPSKLMEIGGLESAVLYKPHRKIGGDFFDLFILPDGRYGLVIADVSGKGVTAAIITAICQTKFSNIAKNSSGVSEALISLNKEILNMMRKDMFVTMTYAIIEKDLSKITFARAGHERPMHYNSATNTTEAIKSSGAAVGVMGSEIFDSAIEERTINFASGDIFMLYTDGITETVNSDGEEFSSKRLLGALTNLHGLPCNAIIENVMQEVQKFAYVKDDFADDVTLLVIKKS